MNIRQANFQDLDIVLGIYEDAREFMKNAGNPNQWGNVNPPTLKTEEDIKANKLFVVCDGDEIMGVFFFAIESDPTYEKIYNGSWINNDPYGVIHRIAISHKVRGKGVAGLCFAFAFNKCHNLKIDTHIDNLPMQRALAKSGFVKCGIIRLANGAERIAFQKTEEIL